MFWGQELTYKSGIPTIMISCYKVYNRHNSALLYHICLGVVKRFSDKVVFGIVYCMDESTIYYIYQGFHSSRCSGFRIQAEQLDTREEER